MAPYFFAGTRPVNEPELTETSLNRAIYLRMNIKQGRNDLELVAKILQHVFVFHLWPDKACGCN